MEISILQNAVELGNKAAGLIARKLNEIIIDKGEARMVVSTGSSQFEVFRALVNENIDWSKVEIFHLDEYIGLPVIHNASFRKYLKDRFISKVPIKKFHSIDVEGNYKNMIRELTFEVASKPLDIGLIGIGVNGHIAFNDPPADFETHDPFIVVKLNYVCKKQQVDEGWFKKMDEVPDEAVSMSVWQIMQCSTIFSVVPHEVKAEAVYRTLRNEVSPDVPATILKRHPDWHLFLDRNSASKVISL